MISVITYNLWHGLSPQGILRFKEIEPRSRRKEREKLQVQLLQQHRASIVFLQEVNPIERRAKELSKKVNMQEVHHRDNSGIRWGQWGAPLNLDSGLCTLFDENHYFEWSEAVPLSGKTSSLIGDKGSFQLKESRFALLLSTIHSEVGRTLWVNTHLHHGIEMNETIVEQLNDLQKKEVISEGVKEEIIERLKRADERRHHEVTILLNKLESLKNRYNLIVIGGDFNARPESSLFERFYKNGFQSMAKSLGDFSPSWDPPKNMANFTLARDHISTFLLEDLSFDFKVRQCLQELAESWESQPRRIDDFLVWSATGRVEISNPQLIGVPMDKEMAPSDHFGVQSEIRWRKRE
ncbi:MAG: endonuclease/exonuclease/phosphatase family protein [Bdellovibrionales bacterium]|nr:endonuclease/exonuclease/phosphatase family protein [Bdellovibrionales bacterium]